jgi:hypothetical protein
MAIKKSDLYSSLWASCDELRGGMDASQYKDYVLFMSPGASVKDMVALKGIALRRTRAGHSDTAGHRQPCQRFVGLAQHL